VTSLIPGSTSVEPLSADAPESVAELRAQLQLYRDLFASAPYGCVLTDAEGIIREANDAIAHMLGCAPDALIGRALVDLGVADELERAQFTLRLDRLRAGQTNEAWAVRFQPVTGEPFDAAVNASCLANGRSAEKTLLLRWVVRDITRPKRTEGMLSQSEQKLRGIFDNSEDGISLVDEQDVIVEWNASMERITGLTRAQVIGKTYRDVVPRLVTNPQFAREVAERIGARLIGAQPWTSAITEIDLQLPDQKRRVFQQSVFPITTANGLMLGSILRDITDRKRMEEALRVANEDLEARVRDRTCALTQAIRDLQDEVARRQTVENSLLQRLSVEKIISQISNRFVNVDTVDIEAEMRRALQQIGEASGVDRAYVALLAADNTTFIQAYVWGAPGIDARAGDALHAPPHIVAHYIEYMKSAGIIHVSTPSDWGAITTDERALLEQRRVQSFIIVPLLYRGNLIGSFGCDAVRAPKTWRAEDITFLQIVAEIFANALEHRRVDQALTESENRQAAILNSVPVILYTLEQRGEQTRPTWMSPNVEQITGFAPHQFIADPPLWFSRIHPDDRAAVLNQVRALDQPASIPIEYRWQCADGSYRWFLDRIERTKPGATEFAGTWLDITKRKRAEEEEHALRLLAEVLRDTAESFNNTLDADQVFKYLLMNVERLVPCDGVNVVLAVEGLPRIFAWQGYEKFTPPNLGSDLAAMDSRPSFLRIAETGQPLLIPDTAQSDLWEPGLASSWVRSFIGMPIRAQGRTVGFLNMDSATPGYFNATHVARLKAITDQASVALSNAQLFAETRQKAERLRLLSRRLVEAQEIERARIARELHDEIGQTLTALMVNLHYIERHFQEPAMIQERTADAKHLTNNALVGLHQLVTDLRPISLEHQGLVSALRQYTESFSRQHQVPVEFDEIGLGETRLPDELEIAVYRIVQEALTNVARHAHAQTAQVLLTQRAGMVSVLIWDNGIGFDPDNPGWKNRMGLVGMRERAEMLGGRFTLESQSGTGTTVRVEVPYVRANIDRG
jgi:PAS domain S-box-containing protein